MCYLMIHNLLGIRIKRRLQKGGKKFQFQFNLNLKFTDSYYIIFKEYVYAGKKKTDLHMGVGVINRHHLWEIYDDEFPFVGYQQVELVEIAMHKTERGETINQVHTFTVDFSGVL